MSRQVGLAKALFEGAETPAEMAGAICDSLPMLHQRISEVAGREHADGFLRALAADVSIEVGRLTGKVPARN